MSPPVYLFGTLHIPYTTLWDSIPENAKTAFSSSEELCLELKLLDPKTASELSNCKMLPSGESLEDRLSLETIGRIQSYLDKIQQLFPRWMGSSGGAGSLLNGGRTGYVDNNYYIEPLNADTLGTCKRALMSSLRGSTVYIIIAIDIATCNPAIIIDWSQTTLCVFPRILTKKSCDCINPS